MLSGLIFALIITFRYMEIIPCPLPPPTVTKNSDGTYAKNQVYMAHSIACHKEQTYQEEWTKLPEEGGTFIRVIPAREKLIKEQLKQKYGFPE